jgi:hypothetical protein
MATLLVYDKRLQGSPPWEQVDATCVVRPSDKLSSILNWLKGKINHYGYIEYLYVMCHGRPGYLQLGHDGVYLDNVHLWGALRGKIGNIYLLPCEVSDLQPGFNVIDGDAHEADGFLFCSNLAGYTKSYVAASSATQYYYNGFLGLIGSETNFGDWEGNVYVWGPTGSCESVFWQD